MRHPQLRNVLIGAGAALALVAGGTAAGAAAFAGSGTVFKGCIEGTNRTMEHVYTRTNPPACPSGSFAATWNQVGQQGPPGVVTGYVAKGGTVTLPNSYTTVDTLNLPSGHFLLNAKATVFNESSLTGEDYIPCRLVDGSGVEVDLSYTALSPGSLNGDQQTVPLTGITNAGGTIQLQCFAGEINATAIQSVIDAIPLASVSATASHAPHLAPLRSGGVAAPQRG